MRKIRRSVERNAKKRAMKAAVSAMMLAGGVMMACPSTLSNVQAATEHWNDASASNLKVGIYGKKTGINIVKIMRMYL